MQAESATLLLVDAALEDVELAEEVLDTLTEEVLDTLTDEVLDVLMDEVLDALAVDVARFSRPMSGMADAEESPAIAVRQTPANCKNFIVGIGRCQESQVLCSKGLEQIDYGTNDGRGRKRMRPLCDVKIRTLGDAANNTKESGEGGIRTPTNSYFLGI